MKYTSKLSNILIIKGYEILGKNNKVLHYIYILPVTGSDLTMVLNEFLRSRAGLTATKYMCYQGGCGTCIVTATYLDPSLQKNKTIAVHSVSFRLFFFKC